MKVLIVEDDHFYATRLAECLLDHGLATDVVKSVEQALECNFTEYAAIIADIMLPNNPEKSGISDESTRAGFFSGLAFCREIKKRGIASPIILLSATSLGVSHELVTWAFDNKIPLLAKEDGQYPLLRALERLSILSGANVPKAFIVHGHDDLAVLELKDYVQNTLRWQEPVVLREQPSRGKTIIEKFEELSTRIDCVFVLLTPDDVGRTAATNDEKRRARQNVIFELGFFYAKMGRKSGRVVVLHKGALELPSDIQGVVYIDISNGVKAAGEEIRGEVASLL